MIPPKEYNNLPVTIPKEMEICNLPDKEFKIFVLRKFGEKKENTERQFNEILKMYKKFNKEIEIIKKNQTNFRAEESNE